MEKENKWEYEDQDIENFDEEYKDQYDEKSFFDKVLNNLQGIGEELLFNVFLLFYLLQDDNVPMKVKATIVGALGYFIAPLDLIPDLVPAAGYVDDAGAVAGALALAAFYVTPQIKERARNKVNELLHK